MSIFAGPKIVDEGLVFSIDAANRKFISPLGNNLFNGAAEVIRSSIPGITVNSFNGVNLGNLNYYTVFAIDYPESSYGGDAVNRHGMTPGLNVRSGTKLYGGYRALHMWVWNNDTSSWLPTSFFNGAHLSGHCYDNWQGAEVGFATELTKFVQDYNNIKNIFKNCTFVLMGSHRADRYNAASREVLYDLGLPIGTVLDSDTPSAPEWILVGKPGLGAGNAYGWVYQNYTTDPTRVAHLNFALPVYGNKDNYLSFDGVNDYISLPNNIGYTDKFTATAWFRHKGNPGGGYHIIFGGSSLEVSIHVSGFLRLGVNTSNGRNVSNFGSGLTDGNWHHVAFVYNGTHRRAYIDGNYIGESSVSGTLEFSFSNRNIGKFGSDNTYWLNGDLAVVSLYNRDLNNDEIKQNFEATRGRYGI
jgi:hypothetical protein